MIHFFEKLKNNSENSPSIKAKWMRRLVTTVLVGITASGAMDIVRQNADSKDLLDYGKNSISTKASIRTISDTHQEIISQSVNAAEQLAAQQKLIDSLEKLRTELSKLPNQNDSFFQQMFTKIDAVQNELAYPTENLSSAIAELQTTIVDFQIWLQKKADYQGATELIKAIFLLTELIITISTAFISARRLTDSFSDGTTNDKKKKIQEKPKRSAGQVVEADISATDNEEPDASQTIEQLLAQANAPAAK